MTGPTTTTAHELWASVLAYADGNYWWPWVVPTVRYKRKRRTAA